MEWCFNQMPNTKSHKNLANHLMLFELSTLYGIHTWKMRFWALQFTLVSCFLDCHQFLNTLRSVADVVVRGGWVLRRSPPMLGATIRDIKQQDGVGMCLPSPSSSSNFILIPIFAFGYKKSPKPKFAMIKSLSSFPSRFKNINGILLI